MWFWNKKRGVRDLRDAAYEPSVEGHREAETKQWWTDFQAEVESVFGAFFKAHDFHAEEFQKQKYKATWYFTSPACRACFYDNIRDGDVNCLIAIPNTPNTAEEKDGWLPYRGLMILAGIEPKAVDALRSQTRKEIFRDIEYDLSRHFDGILSALQTSNLLKADRKFRDIKQSIELEDGSKLLLLERLAKEDEYGEEECARNIYRVRADGSIMWQVKSKFDNAASGPFTSMKYESGTLTAYRWEGGNYEIDIATGEATLIPGQRPW